MRFRYGTYNHFHSPLTSCPWCAGLLHLTLGSTQLGHSAVHSYTPEVGPLSGGTVIEFQVSSDVLT